MQRQKSRVYLGGGGLGGNGGPGGGGFGGSGGGGAELYIGKKSLVVFCCGRDNTQTEYSEAKEH